MKGTIYLRPARHDAPHRPAPKDLDDLDVLLTDSEQRVQQLVQSQEAFHRKHLELVELDHVLRETATFFEEVWPCTQTELFFVCCREGLGLMCCDRPCMEGRVRMLLEGSRRHPMRVIGVS